MRTVPSRELSAVGVWWPPDVLRDNAHGADLYNAQECPVASDALTRAIMMRMTWRERGEVSKRKRGQRGVRE